MVMGVVVCKHPSTSTRCLRYRGSRDNNQVLMTWSTILLCLVLVVLPANCCGTSIRANGIQWLLQFLVLANFSLSVSQRKFFTNNNILIAVPVLIRSAVYCPLLLLSPHPYHLPLPLPLPLPPRFPLLYCHRRFPFLDLTACLIVYHLVELQPTLDHHFDANTA